MRVGLNICGACAPGPAHGRKQGWGRVRDRVARSGSGGPGVLPPENFLKLKRSYRRIFYAHKRQYTLNS